MLLHKDREPVLESSFIMVTAWQETIDHYLIGPLLSNL